MIDASGVRRSCATAATNSARRARARAAPRARGAARRRRLDALATAPPAARAPSARARRAARRRRPRSARARRACARLVVADVAERDERVPAQPARVVPRHVEPVELVDQLARVGLEPRDQIDVRGRVGLQLRAPPLDAAVPRADVLADVAAVDLRAELGAVGLRDRLGRLRPVREAARRVEHAGLVERAGRAGVDAARARAAAGVERRRRLELGGRDERAEHDPRAVPAREHHRVLAVEADARAHGRLAVDVLVRVDEHAVAAAERSRPSASSFSRRSA